jgi:hypothetical protein
VSLLPISLARFSSIDESPRDLDGIGPTASKNSADRGAARSVQDVLTRRYLQ